MSGTETAVTGLGLVTPAGIGVEENWRAVCAGRSLAAEDPELAHTPAKISCRVPGFDADALLGARRALRLDPAARFALVAAREAVAHAGLDPAHWNGARIGVVIGTADGGPGTVEAQHRVLLEEGPHRVSPMLLPMQLPNMLAGQISIDQRATGPSLVVATACASGASAIAMACDLLALDRCDVVIAGGSDAMLTPLLMSGFAQMGALSKRHDDPAAACRPFDAERDGFVGGEGAGMVILERAADARARGATVHGRVLGHGSTADAHHVTTPDPNGRGIEAAVRAALADAGLTPDDIGHVNAHGTSTPANDRVEGLMLRRMFGDAPWVTSTKGVTGHLLGAAGAVEAIYTLLSLSRKTVPPTANLTKLDPELDGLRVPVVATGHTADAALSNSLGFGGQNAVLALAAG